MNQGPYSGSSGKCALVHGARGSIVVMIVDECPGCSHGDLDLSSEGLQATTGYAWDRKPISWSFVPCSSGGSSVSSRKSGHKHKGKGHKHGRKLQELPAAQ